MGFEKTQERKSGMRSDLGGWGRGVIDFDSANGWGEKIMIGFLFSCPQCGLKHRSCKVRFRYQNEELLHWMDNAVTPALSLMHSVLSPMCTAKEIRDVMFHVPQTMPEGFGIGHQIPGKNQEVFPMEPDKLDWKKVRNDNANS